VWSETAGVTEYESLTFYPKPEGTFKVSDIAFLIHNKDLENELAWEDKCNCWYWCKLNRLRKSTGTKNFRNGLIGLLIAGGWLKQD
jgi:hypothetical protein